MNTLRLRVSASLIGLSLALAACGNPASDSTDSADVAAPETEAITEIAPGDAERPTKEVLLARFDAALDAAQATQGPGEPAMWTMSDEDTTIHIFGTVHLLRPELEWRSESFEQALTSSDRVVFEVDMKSEAAQRAMMTDFMARGMYQDGRTLKQVLDDEDEAVITAAFDALGVPIDAMNTFEPWMASINLSAMQLVNDGYDPTSGVESVIEAEALEAGKSFNYLESISAQADAFDLLDEEDQIAVLYETALLLDESPRMLDLLVEEWADGDIDGLAALVASPDGYGFSAALYQSILVDRNESWVPRIEAMLDEPGTVFIAAGAGHFAGPDSVITMLRNKGYTIEGP